MPSTETIPRTRKIPIRDLIQSARRLCRPMQAAEEFPPCTPPDGPISYFDHADFDIPDRQRELLTPLPAVRSTAIRPPAGLPTYVAKLYEVPLLGKDEEADLFLRMNFYRSCARQLQESWLTSATAPKNRAMQQFLSLAETVRNRIVRANLRLVVAIAKRFVDTRHGFDELVSEGHLPLIRAAELFNVGLGNRFSTYATWAVRNHLARYVGLQSRRGEQVGFGDNDSFEQPVTEGADETHRELERQRLWMTQLLTRLAPRDQQVMQARFGLNAHGEAQTLSEIAGDLGLSKERVRQLVLHALDELRDLAVELKGQFKS